MRKLSTGRGSGPIGLPIGLLVALWLVAAPAPVAAQAEASRSAHVLAALDGHALQLEGDVAVLAGIEVPLPGDGAYARQWAARAQSLLNGMAAGRTAQLGLIGSGHDRYGRLAAQVAVDGNVWLQGEMLRAGLARVWMATDASDRLGDMLRLEQEARLARRGIWSDAYFAVLDAESIDRRHLDRLQLVEGKVTAVATVRGTTYLNFGTDWRRDFTVELDAGTRRAFVKAGRDPSTFKDHRLRVRGWPFWRNGPAIDVKYLSQVELLD